MIPDLIIYLLLAFVAAIATIDLARHRIPNLLTVPAAGLAIALHTASTGLNGLLVAGAGLFTGFAMFLPFYLARGFGAGDVKAMAAVGAFLGPAGVVLAGACTLAVGAVMVLGILAVTGGLRVLLSRLGPAPVFDRMIGRRSMHRDSQSAPDSETDTMRRRFPYGLAIATGTLLAVWGQSALQQVPGGVLP